jgi:hypothetical protein
MVSAEMNCKRIGARTKGGQDEVLPYLGPDKDDVIIWNAKACAIFQTKSLRKEITRWLPPDIRSRIPRVARRHLDCFLKFARENYPPFRRLLDDDFNDDDPDEPTEVPAPKIPEPAPPDDVPDPGAFNDDYGTDPLDDVWGNYMD